ncbi:MAG: hypothetical protein HGA38_02750 [Candidatus Moranbacteria bacterium]|nr:hypothetical protein [Candidatus Moranbacteria bacterium]NTW46249.1 hypothetical protein [Candidatus Moranbacteria bacterium]
MRLPRFDIPLGGDNHTILPGAETELSVSDGTVVTENDEHALSTTESPDIDPVSVEPSLENSTDEVARMSGNRESVELSGIEQKIDEMILKAEKFGSELEIRIVERFGAEFMRKVRGMVEKSISPHLKKGESAFNWMEEHRIPLPKSRLATAIVSGTLVSASMPLPPPFGSLLLVPGVVLWSRNSARWAAERGAGTVEGDASSLREDEGDYPELAIV